MNKNHDIVSVILSGGSGSRLWPLSKSNYPKQFLDIGLENSLFNLTMSRLKDFKSQSIDVKTNYVITHENYRFLTLEQVNKLKSIKTEILLESVSKNTAPALTFAALKAIENDSESIMVVMPSDHLIKKHKIFTACIKSAILEAKKNSIVTLGIPPLRNETGFGYIRHSNGSKKIKDVIKFIEKPNGKKANTLLNSGDCLWNSGIFILKAKVWLASLAKSRPDILNAVQKAFNNYNVDGNFIRFNKTVSKKIPSESIDYAVLENAVDLNIPVKVIKLNAGWDDLGSWEALGKLYKKDSAGNQINGNALAKSSKNNIIHSDKKLIVTFGVNEFLIANTDDAILIANKTYLKDMKALVGVLSKNKQDEIANYSKIYRPWGWYETILNAEFFKVKRIHVKPNESLSLQKHKFRSEHWVVIEGEASIQLNDKSIILRANQSTYISKNTVHRLSNNTTRNLEIIEIQSGTYLGEDDIIRFEDKYGR